MGKRKYICSVLLLGLSLTAGCGVSFPEMTAEQEDQIAEYAARAVMRHMRDYDSRLVDLSLYEEKVQEPEKEPEETGMEETADTPTVDISEEVHNQTLEEVLLLNGINLHYTGCLLTATYPEDNGSNPYFLLDASEGKQLLVLQFTLQNVTEENMEVDIFSLAPKCTVLVNGQDRQNVFSTMLLDDLGTFIGKVAPGEAVPLVLLAEIDDTAVVESLQLTVKTDAGTATTLLQ